MDKDRGSQPQNRDRDIHHNHAQRRKKPVGSVKPAGFCFWKNLDTTRYLWYTRANKFRFTGGDRVGHPFLFAFLF